MRWTAFLLFLTAPAAAAESPNCIVIVADDLGYADVGFQGCMDTPTPHIDGLAKRGVRCSNGYVSHPFCSPTRAGLLTGRYQQRFGHENNPAYNPMDEKSGLPLTETLLPELIGKAGYVTGHVGKWHLGAAPHFEPHKRGFAESIGFIGGGHQYFPPKTVPAKGGAEYTVPIRRNGEPAEQKQYMTDELGTIAADFVDRHAGKKPFFLYLAFNAPHTPLQANAEDLEKFKQIGDEKRRTLCAMTHALDRAIGVVLAKLKEKGVEENTLVFFISDNGGPTGVVPCDNSPLRGHKGQAYEGGVRVPFVVTWPAKLKPGVYEKPVSSLDILPTCLARSGGNIPANLDGVDLLPYLGGARKGSPHERLFWRSGGGALHAIREGDWKLVRAKGEKPELYNLASDIGEKRDLAAATPDKVAALEKTLNAWDAELLPPAFPNPPGPKKNKK